MLTRSQLIKQAKQESDEEFALEKDLLYTLLFLWYTVWTDWELHRIHYKGIAYIEAVITKLNDVVEKYIQAIESGIQRSFILGMQTTLNTLINRVGESAGSIKRVPPETVAESILSDSPATYIRTLLNEIITDVNNIYRVSGLDVEMVDNALSLLQNKLMRTARTEMLNAYRKGVYQVMEQNSELIKGWIRMSQRDDLTCVACWAEDGTWHSVDEILEDHPNGRCWMLIVGQGETVEAWEGESVFSHVDSSTQKAVLGPTRYRMYKRQQYGIKDMVQTINSPQGGSYVVMKPLYKMKK